MKIVRWNPGFTMRWLNEFDRYADQQLQRPNWYADTKMGLAVDVSENDEGYVVKASIPGINVEDVEIIFRALPKSGGGRHFGSRLLFDREGYLLITLGDRGDRPRAQDLGGKDAGIHGSVESNGCNRYPRGHLNYR